MLRRRVSLFGNHLNAQTSKIASENDEMMQSVLSELQDGGFDVYEDDIKEVATKRMLESYDIEDIIYTLKWLKVV